MAASAGGRPGTSNKIRTQSGRMRPRTFTARPAVATPPRRRKADYSHSDAQLAAIATETRSLVNRLQRVYGRPRGESAERDAPPRGLPCNEAPAARSRCACTRELLLESCLQAARQRA
jgi:hypothetical protein